jgi:cysteine desulfurase family protein
VIYLDNAATSYQKAPGVEEAVLHALKTSGNPGRGAHKSALDAARTVYETREKLAELFHISNPARIAFTSNATMALNTAINGIFFPGDHILTTVCEHNSVLRPLYLLEEQGAEVTYVPADRQGRIAYEEMASAVKANTRAIVITHASNLTGNLTDLKRVSQIARKNGLLLLVDASQSAGAFPIDVEEMGIDILCFTGHKSLLGPQGTGGLYVREGLPVRPLMVGGSGIHSYDRHHPTDMPEALEAGTLNTHGIAGLHAALSYINETGIDTIRRRELALMEQFQDGVRTIPGIHLYGDPDPSHRVGILSLNVEDQDSAVVSDLLWEEFEISTRPGAHCAPRMHEALGTVRQGAVRFSISHFTTESEIAAAIEALREIQAYLQP